MPIKPFARSLVMIEQFAGVAYIAMVVSRLVGLLVVHPERPEAAALGRRRALARQLAAQREAADLEALVGRITCITALISARCVKACGKLPRWRPERGSISSA